MSQWPLNGGAVQDRPSDQNFRALSRRGGELESKLVALEKEGLPPSGKAEGVLKGFYPAPEFAKEPAYKAELENETTARKEADTTLKTSIETEKTERETADKAFVKGPASAVEGDIAVYDGTTGKLVKDGGKTVAQVLARENHTGTQIASTISNFDTQVRTSRLDQMATPTSDVSWGSKKITSLADPTEALDAANKSYVDSAASAAAAGLSIKNPVAYATTAAITVSKATEKTLEGTGELKVDGELGFAEGTRLLLKTQASPAQNGIFTVTEDKSFAGSGKFGGGGKFAEGKGFLLTRATDADTTAEVVQGMYVPVTGGTVNKATSWTLATENPIVIGTTAQEFSPFTATPGGAAGGDLKGSYPNPEIGKEVIVNEDVSASAAIAYSKLNLAASVKDSDLTSPTNATYKLLDSAESWLVIDAAAATYIIGTTHAANGSAASGAVLDIGATTPTIFDFAAADYEVNGKTQKLRLRVQVLANATKPLIKFTFGLYPITVAGGADSMTMTLGTVVSGSTVVVTEPAASTVTRAVGSDFTIPADGVYVLGCATSATLTNNAATLLGAQIQSRNV